MKFEIRWLTPEKDRLLIDYTEKINWPDFQSSLEQADGMISPLPNRVDIIILDRFGMPSGYPLQHIRKALQNQPANVGSVFIATATFTPGMLAFVKRLTEIAGRLFPTKKMPRIVHSLDEAVALLDREQVVSQAKS